MDFWISLDFWISDWISADSVRDFFRGGPLRLICIQVPQVGMQADSFMINKFALFAELNVDEKGIKIQPGFEPGSFELWSVALTN